MTTETKFVRRKVRANLVEATPGLGGLGHWILASPLLGFLAWLWVDIFRLFSPLHLLWLEAFLGLLLFTLLFVLPLGYGAHRLVLALPRIFQHAGWDVEPLEPVTTAEQYMVQYLYQDRRWAPGSWPRTWLRAAQGWVYLEIATILGGSIGMVLLFFSAVEYGFGR